MTAMARKTRVSVPAIGLVVRRGEEIASTINYKLPEAINLIS
jgi:hypothetical protein